MKKSIKEKWMAALRSGEYIQGSRVLARIIVKPDSTEEIHYCCLGVLCDLAIKEGIITSYHDTWRQVIKFNGADGVLPDSVAEWAGLQDPSNPNDSNLNPTVIFRAPRGLRTGAVSLSRCNDGGLIWGQETIGPMNFQEIADLIETSIPGEDDETFLAG